MSEINAEAYEPTEVSFAKNWVLGALDDEIQYGGPDSWLATVDQEYIDLIEIADIAVEALRKAGVVIPEDLPNAPGFYNPGVFRKE